MVKIPQDAERSNNPEQIKNRTQLLHDMGVLVTIWNRVELYVEFEIYRITKLSATHCSIMLGGLMHKAKISILYALLREDGRTEAISKFKTAISYAKRNALLHGIPGSESDGSKFVFYHRMIDDRYRVKSHDFTADSFHEHVWEFGHLADEALMAIGIDDNDPAIQAMLQSYGKNARFDGLD